MATDLNYQARSRVATNDTKGNALSRRRVTFDVSTRSLRKLGNCPLHARVAKRFLTLRRSAEDLTLTSKAQSTIKGKIAINIVLAARIPTLSNTHRTLALKLTNGICRLTYLRRVSDSLIADNVLLFTRARFPRTTANNSVHLNGIADLHFNGTEDAALTNNSLRYAMTVNFFDLRLNSTVQLSLSSHGQGESAFLNRGTNRTTFAASGAGYRIMGLLDMQNFRPL